MPLHPLLIVYIIPIDLPLAVPTKHPRLVPVCLGRHPVVAAFFPDVPRPDEHAAEGEGGDSGLLVNTPSAEGRADSN
jgi:hypothetical protein